MNCRRVDLLLSDHLEGFLTPRLSRAVTAHLDGCPRCRQRRIQLSAVGAELRHAEALCRPPSLLDRAMESWLSERETLCPAPRAASGGRRATSSVSRSPFLFSGSRYRNGWAAAAVGAAVLAGAAMIAGSFHGPFSGKETPGRHLNVTDATRPGGPQMAQGSPLALSGGGSRRAAVRQHPARSVKRDEVPGAIAISGRYPAERAPWIRPAADADRRRGRHARTHGARGSFPPPTGDLAALNGDPLRADQCWKALPQDEWQQIEVRVRRNIHVRDDFVTILFPRIASTSDRQIAQAVESYKREAAIVDPRLSHEVTCAFKATALSDLCDQLRADTGIQLTAGSSVADEKVTIFCEQMPLRDVMRQLSRPFGYTWLRSKKEGGEYRYELVQDLRSQLLEEELRNRDRNAALLALEREIDRYRPYLGLSPDEARARAATAAPEEKPLLEKLARYGWGPIQMYFRLSPPELAALRAGQKLVFSADPRPDQQPLPSDLERGVLQCVTDVRLIKEGDGYSWSFIKDPTFSTALPLTAVAEARAYVDLSLRESELGQFTLGGGSGCSMSGTRMFTNYSASSSGPNPVGMSPAVIKPDNRAANASLANDPALRRRISLQPEAHCGEPPAHASDAHQSKIQNPKSKIGRVTSADVLEALHQATGLPIVADYYTHLYPVETVSGRDQPLFELLNQLGDAMRVRWHKEDRWLQFRSASYYNDRLKEVPNRLLTRWAAARRQPAPSAPALPLDDLLEIAQLSDTQLDATDMAEGARECFGLTEWGIARTRTFRPQLRFLAQLTPAQRQEAQSDAGLPFSHLTLPQQQQFIFCAFAADAEPLQSLEQVAGASLHVRFTHPGWFQWNVPEGVTLRSGTYALSPVLERTRAAALHAALRLSPQASDTQIAPTELALTLVYTTGSPRTGFIVHAQRATPSNHSAWGRRFPGEGEGRQGASRRF